MKLKRFLLRYYPPGIMLLEYEAIYIKITNRSHTFGRHYMVLLTLNVIKHRCMRVLSVKDNTNDDQLNAVVTARRCN